MIFIQLALLVVGFVFLVKGADFFVDGSSAIARIFKIPSIVIGLTIVSFGTSLPELAVSVTSAIKGVEGIAIGNVIGSNIVNLMLVSGVAAFIAPMAVSKSLLYRDFPFSILIATALLVMLPDMFFNGSANMISRSDAILLLLFFAIFMYSTVSYTLKSQSEENIEEDNSEKTISVAKSILLTVLGLVGVIAGGQMVVKSTSWIASAAGMSDNLIGLTIVAFGTSLPELVTSVVAAKKGENDIAMGNVIGSNIFNILFILGIAAVIRPIGVETQSIFDALILIAFSATVWILARPKFVLGKFAGFIMVLLYAAYDFYIFLR